MDIATRTAHMVMVTAIRITRTARPFPLDSVTRTPTATIRTVTRVITRTTTLTAYYGYNRPGYNTYANDSIVIQVQSRLARAGYYRGPIDGAMGPRTHYAIRAYERDHGLRVDGVVSGQLLRNMGLRY